MMKKLIVIVLVIALAAVLYVSSITSISVEVAVVGRGPVEEVVEERARTSLPHIHRLTMPQNGRVLPIEVREGDRVEAGQVLARLDPDDLESDLHAARAQVGLAEANIAFNLNRAIAALSLTEYGAVDEAVKAVIESALEREKANQAQQEYAVWWVKSLEEAMKADAVAEQQLREAQMREATSQVDLTTTRLFTSALRAFDAAFSTYPKYVDAFMKLQDEQLDAQKSQLEAAKVDLGRAERNRARDHVASLVDGVVLKRHFADEMVLPAGTVLLEVGDLLTMEATAEVLTGEVLAIVPGQRAEVIGLGDEPLLARVDRVEPAAFTKLSSLGVEEQRVRVVVTPEPASVTEVLEKGLPLGVGYSVRVRIRTDFRDDCLCVSRRALIREGGGRWSVFIIDGGKARKVEVKLGLIGDRTAEVVEGLSVDQQVVLSPPSMLEDGGRVSVELVP
jgi:HlyD family secretion protein